MSKLDTSPYKGVRDFYPGDQFVQNHIFDTWRKTLESFGYQEYSASILEPAELYRAKTGEEIVNEQTYTFTDRGEREVTLRPEMTPTVARMVAAKKRELAFPLRWYSIPNLFRYEAPQRGRLREHWQLNADIFGIETIEAELEIIEIAYKVMKNFGASDTDFIIRINSRKILDKLYDLFSLSSEEQHSVSKLVDKKAKISKDEFDSAMHEILGERAEKFIELIESPDKLLEKLDRSSPEVEEVLDLSEKLDRLGVSNIIFDITLMRGFDYYTCIVFEVFDTHPDNKRSLFGGGRYDNLLELFGEDRVPAVGFGSGDVTMRDFLETRGLLPGERGGARVGIACVSNEYSLDAARLADELRNAGISTVVDYSGRKVGDQIRSLDKQGVKNVIVIGEDEVRSGTYKIKNLETGEEKAGPVDFLKLELNK